MPKIRLFNSIFWSEIEKKVFFQKPCILPTFLRKHSNLKLCTQCYVGQEAILTTRPGSANLERFENIFIGNGALLWLLSQIQILPRVGCTDTT